MTHPVTNKIVDKTIGLLSLEPNEIPIIACQESFLVHAPHKLLKKARIVVVPLSLKSASSLRSWLQLNEVKVASLYIVDFELNDTTLNELNPNMHLLVVEEMTGPIERLMRWRSRAHFQKKLETVLVCKSEVRSWINKNYKVCWSPLIEEWGTCRIPCTVKKKSPSIVSKFEDVDSIEAEYE